MKKVIFIALVAVGVLLSERVAAQATPVPGWDPLPDSLFMIWKLDQDQIQRLRVIEEDHNAEKATILAAKNISAEVRDQRLRSLAIERRNEIRAVLQLKQFEDWERRCSVAAR